MVVHKLSSLLNSSIASKSLSQGKLLHSKIITLGFQNHLQISKTLVNFYLSFNLYNSARLVLETDQNPHEISLWNPLVAAFSRNRMHKEALYLFNEINHSMFVKPDSYTYPSALKACGGSGNARVGEAIHAQLVKLGFESDIVVSSSLVGMYAKCGRYDAAVMLFDEMPERDVASWNTVISCYYQDGQASKALGLFDRMVSEGFKPDSVTFTTALSACARLADLEKGRRIHEQLVWSGIELDEFVTAAVVDMYGKCGHLESAREVFENIRGKSVVVWNSMIGGYSLVGDTCSCFELFLRMNGEGVRPTSTTMSNLLMACSRTSDIRRGKFVHGYFLRTHMEVDIFVKTSIIDLYFKCGNVVYAESFFKGMSKEIAVAWNVMVSGYVAAGRYFKALETFHEMRACAVRPDAFTFASALSACAQIAALEQGKEIHKLISYHGFESNEIVMCALLDMYAKCGAVEEARLVFDGLQVRDTVSWTSMIMAYGSHGQVREALGLFNEMERLKERPDHVVFLAVISACSHGGLVDEGHYYFNRMTDEYGIKPALEHYSCLIDLLGRSGRLNEAYDILNNMPSIEVDAGLLGTLFSACSLHGNLELGEELGRRLIQMNPNDHSTYVVLSNIYAFAGKWDEVRKMRTMINQRGLKKNPGCSWVEIDKKIHQFYAKDDSHEHAELINDCMTVLLRHMEKDTSELSKIESSLLDQASYID